MQRPEFANAFGSSFQDYVGEVLATRITVATMRNLPEQEYRRGNARKASVDWIVAGDDAALFLECKTKRLTWNSKSDLDDLAFLDRDIGKLAEAVAQVYRTIIDYRDGLYPHLAFQEARKVFPIVVTLEDWFFFGEELPNRLDAEVRRLMGQANVPLEWLDTMPYSVMSLHEVEVASGVINEVGIAPFMEGKVRDPERRRWAYHSYCFSQYPDQARGLPRLFQEQYDAVFADIIPRPNEGAL